METIDNTKTGKDWVEAQLESKISIEFTLREVISIMDNVLYLKMVFNKNNAFTKKMGGLYRIMAKFLSAADLTIIEGYIRDGVKKDMEKWDGKITPIPFGFPRYDAFKFMGVKYIEQVADMVATKELYRYRGFGPATIKAITEKLKELNYL